MRYVYFAVIVFVLSIFVETGKAQSVTLQATQDNSIYSDNTNFSNGAGDFIFAGQNGQSSARRALLQFDFSSLPTGAQITGVQLDLVATQVSSSAAFDVSLHRVESAWGESTSDANGGEGGGITAEQGDATWVNTFFDAQLWNNPGGDFDAIASATTSVSVVGDYSWSGQGLIDDVQNFLDGTTDNFGWILIGDETGPSTAKRFNSRDNATSNPVLTIEFTAVPEPGSTAAFAVIGAFALIRRKR